MGRYDYGRYSYGFAPYVSVAERREKARLHVEKLRKKGQIITPIQVQGLAIAKTFWGKAWCKHLEAYSDFANRLPRGRTYVRNGSVVDLQIAPGQVTALVSGSSIYQVAIQIKPLPPDRWNTLKGRCSGRINSVLELLQGRIDSGVMEVITARDDGMFPAPPEISLACSCPDGAYMCKHLAATLYGIGARLDQEPELLFKLRQVDHFELIQQAVGTDSLAAATDDGRKTIADNDLAEVFGIDLEKSVPENAKSARGKSLSTRPDSKKAKPVTSAVVPTQKPKIITVQVVRAKMKKAKSPSLTRSSKLKTGKSKSTKPGKRPAVKTRGPQR